MSERRLEDAAALALVIGCSARSILRQYEQGRIPGYRVSTRRVRFDVEEVLAAMREQRA